MRNLKRVLSLALASAMLLGMMVMGAGAADTTTYADQNSITNKEAVAVMSAIGTFQGADGKFNPTAVLTRESAAKIITYMVMGKAAADDLSTTAAPFTDVAANRWSAGAIAYCVSQGIISGDGQGHFYPELTVNGYAFAKMVLCALGYDAQTESLVGNGWESNVSKLVNKLNLKKGISNALSKDMTREQAAQMAFNAMSAQTVSYSGGADINLGEGSINIGGTKDYGDTFMKENYPTLKSTTTTDAAGRPGVEWKLGTTKIGKFGATADYVFTAKTKKADLSMGDITYTATDVVANSRAEAPNAIPAQVSTEQGIADLTRNGRTVEVYTTTNAESGVVSLKSVVVTDTYLYTIASINTVAKSVSFKGVPVLKAVTDADQSALYAALVAMGKDTKVLVTATDDGTVLTIAEPETVNGTYTAKASNGDRTVGGTKYTDSVMLNTADFGNYGTSYTLYLDTYGYTVGASEETAAETKHAYLKNVDTQGSVSTGLTYLAQLVFTDGTQEWIEVTKVDNTATSKMTSFDDFKKALFDGSTTKETIVVSYSEKSDGTYNLNTLDKGTLTGGNIGADEPENDTFYAFTDLDVKKGAAQFFSTTTSGTTTAKDIMGSSKTIFMVEKDNKFTAYTGVKNVPNLTGANGTVLVSKDSKTASLVVISTATNAVDSSALVYVVKDTGSEYNETTKDTVFTFEAIVKGEVTTLTSTVSKDGIDGKGDAIAKGLYTASYDANGYAVAMVKVTTNDLIATGSKAAVDNGTITLTGAGSYVTADDFKVFVIDKNNKAAEITADDVAYYTSQESAIVILDSDKEFATTLIVVETPAT